MLSLQEMQNVISDLHKDAFGHRPTVDKLMYLRSLPLGELQVVFDEWSEIVGDLVDAESEAEELAVAKFEAKVSEVMLMGASDRETAIRWMYSTTLDTMHSPQDVECLVWNMGFLHTTTGRELVDVLCNICKDSWRLKEIL